MNLPCQTKVWPPHIIIPEALVNSSYSVSSRFLGMNKYIFLQSLSPLYSPGIFYMLFELQVGCAVETLVLYLGSSYVLPMCSELPVT
jgi:hypothetical protein